MANEQDERVSALADGEFDPRQLDGLLARMGEDDALRARWARYHLISDALHNNLTRGTKIDISQRISAALEQEPVIFAPVWARLRPSRRMVRQAAGVAVAASVTAVAILGAQWVNQEQPAVSMAMAGGGAPTLVAMEQAAPEVAPDNQEVWMRSLDSYVVNHNEYSGSADMHGVLPYARLVSHESQQ